MASSEYSPTVPVVPVRLALPCYVTHRLALRAKPGPVQEVAGRWLLTERGVTAFEQRCKLNAERTPPAASHATHPDQCARGSSALSQTGKTTARLPRARAGSENV